MTVRLIEGEKPYTAGDGIDISTDKVISVLLREENNLIHLNSNNELYTDLQIVAGAKPTDDFEVGVTTGRVLESDGRPKTGTLLHYETTSGDYCQWLYGTDSNLYFDGGDGNRRQVYYADQVNEIFIRWMDFYFNTPTGNNITLDLSTDYTPTGDFTINAPEDIKDGQTYILRVNNGDTAYTMSLGTNIDNMQGTDISLTPKATDMFVFLAVGGKLELQREVYTGAKIFYIKGDYSDGDDVGAEMEEWLNGTGQPSVFKDALIVETDGENLVYHRLDSYWEENGSYMISFATRTRIENNSADGTSRTKMRVIRFYFTYSDNTWTYTNFVDDAIYTTEKYLRADYDYATPYTPVYDGSPVTKKYVDDSIRFVTNVLLGNSTQGDGFIGDMQFISYKMNADSSGNLYVPTGGVDNGGNPGATYAWKISVDGGPTSVYTGTSTQGGCITLSGYTAGTNHLITVTPVTEEYQRARAFCFYNTPGASYITEIVYDGSYMGFAVSATDAGNCFREREYSGCVLLTKTCEEYMPDTVTTIGHMFREGQYDLCSALTTLTDEKLSNAVTSIGMGFRQGQYYGCIPTSTAVEALPNTVTSINAQFRANQYTGCTTLTRISGIKDLDVGSSAYRDSQFSYCTANKTIKVLGNVGYAWNNGGALQNSSITEVQVPNEYLSNFKNTTKKPRTDITDSKFVGY